MIDLQAIPFHDSALIIGIGCRDSYLKERTLRKIQITIGTPVSFRNGREGGGYAHMMEQLRSMMDSASNDQERDAIRRCMDQLNRS